MKKWKYKKTEKLHENIDRLCEHYKLSDEIKEAVTTLSKNSYTLGSNDCYILLKRKNGKN